MKSPPSLNRVNTNTAGKDKIFVTLSKNGFCQLSESLLYVDQCSGLNNIPCICLDWMFLYKKH